MDVWTDGKAGVGRVREEKRRREKIAEEKVRRKKMQSREKDEKIVVQSVFPMICGSGGSTNRLAKEAGAEPAGQMGEMQNCTLSRCSCAKRISKPKV